MLILIFLSFFFYVLCSVVSSIWCRSDLLCAPLVCSAEDSNDIENRSASGKNRWELSITTHSSLILNSSLTGKTSARVLRQGAVCSLAGSETIFTRKKISVMNNLTVSRRFSPDFHKEREEAGVRKLQTARASKNLPPVAQIPA